MKTRQISRLMPRLVAFGLSALVTLATMGGVDFIAAAEGAPTALMALAAGTLA